MITQVKDFISTIVADVRTSTYVQGKVASGKWLSGAPYYYHGTPIEINNILSKLRKGKAKFPAVLLFEPITMGENERDEEEWQKEDLLKSFSEPPQDNHTPSK